MNKFPKLTARNLHRQKLQLPNDFDGEWNIVIVAFKQWHQSIVDTWLPFLGELEKRMPSIRYYELPTIQRMNFIAHSFINEGMRAGIADPIARERTITLYLNKSSFKKVLELENEEDIYLLVVNKAGDVIYKSKGGYSMEKAQSLTNVLVEQSTIEIPGIILQES